MSTRRRALLARRILVLLLVPTMAFGQIPPAAQETLDQLQDSPGLSISTAPECCPPPSIWDHLGIHQIEDKIHATADKLGQLPLIKGLCQQLTMALGAMGLAESPAAQPNLPPPGGPTPAGGGAAGAIAQKIEADKKAADDKVKTLEYLAQQDCNAYPEIVPAVLEMLDDPIERVRYAALVALQKQCRELRCSTLPATRLRYRLHDQVFIDHCRQCASCACQQQVIKRLSDLLLDETALGYPKENSPRVRSLAAAILERCLHIHPVEPDSPRTPGVQPDPLPPPVPDPDVTSTTPRFPAVPLFQRRPQASNKGWLRNLFGKRGTSSDPYAGSVAVRGQSPDLVFNEQPAVDLEETENWEPVSASASTTEFESAPASSEDSTLTPSSAERAAQIEWPAAAPAGADDAESQAMRTELLHSIVAEAEAIIRETAAERDGATRQQFEDAVATLCRARLALALDGDLEQADYLYADAAELCGNLPNSTPAVLALDAATRYYAAKSGEATSDGRTALKRYAAFLGYRVVAFEDIPEYVPWDLFQAARRLHRAGLNVEAARSLQQIVDCCPHHAIASDAAELLATIASPSDSDDQPKSFRPDSALAAGTADFNRHQPESEPVAPEPSTAEEPVTAAKERLAPLSPDDVARLQQIIADAEQAARANLATRHGAGAAAFEQAVAQLFDARLQLALRGDEQQFRELNNDAQGLCTQDPNSRGAEIAMQALTQYFKAQSGEETPESQKALRYYARCLRYFLGNFDKVPADAPQELLTAASALRRIGAEDQAIASLQSIVTNCNGTTIADEAGVLLAEFESQPGAAQTALAESEVAEQAAPPAPPPDMEEERARLNLLLADAEASVQASFADRQGATKAEFEAALALLCETRLQLALQGDQDQFKALYEDAETMCKEAPSSASAEIAMNALTSYYKANAGATTTEERDALRRYAGCLRYRVARFASSPEESAQALLDAGDALHHAGMKEDAALCYRSVAKAAAGTELASTAAKRLQPGAVPPAKDAKSTVVAADAEAGASAGSAIASTSNATESATDENGEPLMLDTVVTTRSLTAPPPAPPADGAVVLPVEESVGMASVVEPFEDPFGPNPLAEDVVERAQRALEANEFAYHHLQEEDNIVERYNNSVGVKYAPYSMFHITGAQPGNIFKLRFTQVWDYHRPDRSEYLWKRIKGIAKSPLNNLHAKGSPRFAESGLDYQQILVYQELSSGMASVFNEYPIWLLNPEQNPETAGFGNMTVGLKAVMIQDDNWTVTSISKTFIPTGNPSQGTGNGHMSLEQGVAVQLRAGRETFAFGDLRFHYPIAADPDFGGEVLIGGIGFNHVIWTDPIAPPVGRSRALLLTAETIFTSFLDGKVTPFPFDPLAPTPRRDAEMISIMQNLGLRQVWTKRFSTGGSIGFPLEADHLYDFSFLFEVQWVH